eukprot:scaffold2663_cov256-Pinguiococcus_pyrenoidosus.AAC.5
MTVHADDAGWCRSDARAPNSISGSSRKCSAYWWRYSRTIAAVGKAGAAGRHGKSLKAQLLLDKLVRIVSQVPEAQTPPISCEASNTVTFRPAPQSSLAATRPPGPAPRTATRFAAFRILELFVAKVSSRRRSHSWGFCSQPLSESSNRCASAVKSRTRLATVCVWRRRSSPNNRWAVKPIRGYHVPPGAIAHPGPLLCAVCCGRIWVNLQCPPERPKAQRSSCACASIALCSIVSPAAEEL